MVVGFVLVTLVSGTPVGPPVGLPGSGGFGTFGGSGGCDLLALRLGEIRCTNSGSSGAAFFGVVSACFLLELALAYLT